MKALQRHSQRIQALRAAAGGACLLETLQQPHDLFRPKNDLPGAMKYYERCLSLPLHAGMTEADVTRVAEALTDILK